MQTQPRPVSGQELDGLQRMTPAGADAPALVTVIGEAIVDLIPGSRPRSFEASPGGSPFNVAVGLARRGQATALMARLGDGAFGRLLRDQARAEGILLDAAPHAAELATLAVVSLDAEARASYDFYADGTADWQWTPDEISRVPAATAVLHFGSLASWTAPGAEHILGLADRMRDRGDVLVSYDPNIRAGLLPDRGQGRELAGRAVRCAHLVKASAEDIAWLYPGRDPQDVARYWLELGAAVVVITAGPAGADAFRRTEAPLHRPALDVEVADTVGAGDAFTAGLIGALVEQGRYRPAELARAAAAALAAAVDEAILSAALTCQRPGADPPTAAELAAARSRRLA
jgi:fructokinase